MPGTIQPQKKPPTSEIIDARAAIFMSWKRRICVHVEPATAGGPGLLVRIRDVRIIDGVAHWVYEAMPEERGFENLRPGGEISLQCDLRTMELHTLEPRGLRQGGYVSYTLYTHPQLVGAIRFAFQEDGGKMDPGRLIVGMREVFEEEWAKQMN